MLLRTDHRNRPQKSMSAHKLTQEPALLYLIFRELHQLDLLRIQRVCRTWRATITGSKELLSVLFLHPGPPKNLKHVWHYKEFTLNPLLVKAFPSFFKGSRIIKNEFTTGRDHAGPWKDFGHWEVDRSHWTGEEDWQWKRHEKYMYPEASWRRMLPCWPPASQLIVRLLNGPSRRGGRHARLDFSNQGFALSTHHPQWLTFGLLYDMGENAWFRGVPHYLDGVSFPYLGIAGEFEEGPMHVGLDLHIGHGSVEERTELHHQAFAKRLAYYEEDCRKRIERQKSFFPTIQLCGYRTPRPNRPRIFNDDFHFGGGLSFLDIAWDELQVYTRPPQRHWPPPPGPAPPPPPTTYDIEWNKIGGMLLLMPFVVCYMVVVLIERVRGLCKKAFRGCRQRRN